MHSPPVTPIRQRPVFQRQISNPSPPKRPLSPTMFNGRVKALPSPPIEPEVYTEVEWASHQRRLSDFPVPPEVAQRSFISEIDVRRTVDSFFDDEEPMPSVYGPGNHAAYRPGYISSVPIVRVPQRPPQSAPSDRPFSVLSPAIQLTAGPFDPGARPILARRFQSFDEVPTFRLRRHLQARPGLWSRMLHKIRSWFYPNRAEANRDNANLQ